MVHIRQERFFILIPILGQVILIRELVASLNKAVLLELLILDLPNSTVISKQLVAR